MEGYALQALPLKRPSKLERMADTIEELLDADPCADEAAIVAAACQRVRVDVEYHTAELERITDGLRDERDAGACTVEVARFLLEHLTALRPQRVAA
jgi:hypothetical protein